MKHLQRDGFWFGTINRMQWIKTPLSGAEMGAESWGTDDTFLNGGAYVRQAWGNHRVYVLEWGDSSSRDMAQLMQGYRNGTFGRGLIYFQDPLSYDKNILPARWADPSMAIADEGAPLVYGSYPEGVVTSGGAVNQLPVRSAYYNLDSSPSGYRSDAETLFVPIPQGYSLYLGAMFEATGTGGVFATAVDANGNNGATTALTPVDNDASNIVPQEFNGGNSGVRLWVGKSSSGDASVTLTAMTARLYPTGSTPPASFFTGPWITGMGHSGCRFQGNPTYVANTGLEGGRIGFAATLIEVGDWS